MKFYPGDLVVFNTPTFGRCGTGLILRERINKDTKGRTVFGYYLVLTTQAGVLLVADCWMDKINETR